MALHLCILNALLGNFGKKWNITKCLPKWLCVYLSWMHYLGNFEGHYINFITWYFHVFAYFCLQKWLFANAFWSFLADKNLWFSFQRRREVDVGVLMAALANIMGIDVSTFSPAQKLACLFFGKMCQLLFQIISNLKVSLCKINCILAKLILVRS